MKKVIPGIVKVIVFYASWFVFGVSFLSAQPSDTITVKGKVVNSVNEPVANVSIAVEGSFELPEFTDPSGNFSIKVTSGYKWLNIVPSSGYHAKRVFINNRTDLIIYLTDENLSSGYKNITLLSTTGLKRNVVSSFSELNAKNIKYASDISVDQFMQGRVPGMHVVNYSGHPGSGAFLLMRGIKSLNASNQMLYVVDGIPMSSVNIINSNVDGYSYNPLLSINNLDISSVNVIKDPVLTAAYGSKASNGIVFIETITPSATQTVIDFDFRSGYSLSPAKRYPQLDASQHKTLVNEILFSSGKFEEVIREEYPNLFLLPDDDRFIDYQHNTDWQDQIFDHAVFNNLNVTVKGGDEIARYGLSFGYTTADGIIKNTGYDGYNLRFISLLNIFPWLKMNAGMSLNYSSSLLKESAKVAETSPILSALGKSPLLNPYQYDDEGREISSLTLVDELGISNPKAVIENFEALNNNFHFISSIGFEATIQKDLSLNSKFGLTYNELKEFIFMPNKGMERYYNSEAINVSKGTNNSLFSFYNNTYLNYRHAFGDDHNLISTTGVNLLSNQYEYDWGLTKNAPENDQYRMLQHGISSLEEIGGLNRNFNWLSFYEYISYSYRDKYLVSASVSLDGSSRVGKNADRTFRIGGVPYGFFYAGGVGWRISSEPFLNRISWLEEVKLRFSYGFSGNDDIGESNATNYYKSINFRETIGLFPAVIPNDKLTYESVNQFNGGIDISLWGSKMTASVDLYRSVTSHMLVYVPMEAYFGYDFRPENNGEMQNNGIDLGLFFRVIDRPSFKWDIQTSLSTVKNEVLAIKGDKLVTELKGAEIVNMPGQTANSFYGYLFNGVYATSLEAENANLVNKRKTPYQAGDAIFADLSGPEAKPDGIINDYDKTTLGSSLPEYFGGLSNVFSYKRWSLHAFVQFVTGNELFNYVRYQNESMSGLHNQSSNVLERWQYEGHQTTIPRAEWADVQGNSDFSSRWIEDGSYMRVKNVTLMYTIPDKFLTFKNAQFYISASNLFTLSEYLGYDPEFAYSYMQMEQGIDYGLTPQPRQFIVGLKLGL